ncbi:hypothetical protein L9F63_002139 [Diploptera punctata]|uniref:Uncharacterized protein n=1 Tax=Diploptera punctata TaxID=6984 RepID=A0AAD8EIE6_DIPPU|nr:hypothetical protein L9F63_002139 [Diploptera punctata]
MWTPQQKVFWVLSIAEHESVIREFVESVPTYMSIIERDRQLRETGSLLS